MGLFTNVTVGASLLPAGSSLNGAAAAGVTAFVSIQNGPTTPTTARITVSGNGTSYNRFLANAGGTQTLQPMIPFSIAAGTSAPVTLVPNTIILAFSACYMSGTTTQTFTNCESNVDSTGYVLTLTFSGATDPNGSNVMVVIDAAKSGR